MFNNSSQFPHQNFEQFKQLKFVFDDSSSPKQQSPVKPYEQNASKAQQKSNLSSKQKGKASPQPAIPSHNFSSGSKGNAPQRPADPFGDSLGQSAGTNAYAQSLSSSTGGVRLQDLCPEDKQKIGELIKKLAEEKEEKEKLRKQLETKDVHYQGLIENLTKENEDIVKNAADLQSEFKSSLSLLKSFQDSTNKQQRQKSKERIRQQQQQEEEEDDLQFSHSQPPAPHFSQSTSQRRDRKTKSISNNPDDLTVSYLDKGETLRENRERFSPVKDTSQRSRQPELRMQEQNVHRERPVQEAKPPKNKGNVIETLKKEQKAIDEISKLKEDIEGLASSFKKINFSPVESFGAKENEAPRGHQPVFENKNSSPIKLIQNYNTASSEKYQRYEQGYQEHYSPPRQPKSPAQQVYYQESFGKQPSGLKATSSYNSNQKSAKHEEQGNSSSDDDEVAIAQKWLNLRKQKIQQINKELNKEKESPKPQRYPQESQRKEMYYTGSDEKRKRGEEESLYQSRRDEHMQQRRRDHDEYDQDEERYRMEQEIQRLQMQLQNERRQQREEQINRNRPPPLAETQSNRTNRNYPQQRFEEVEERDQYSQTWRKNSPPVREIRGSGGFSSAALSGGKTLKDQVFSKQSLGSGSKFQQEALSPTGIVNLNQMSIEDLVNLKSVLDERIRTEKPEALREHRQEYIQSPSRGFMHPQNQHRHDDMLGQRTFPKGNLSPKMTTMETDSHFLDRFGRSGQKTFPTEDHDYERRLVESTIHGRTDPHVDMSLMRDFNSIGNTPAARNLTEGITFPTETPMTQKTETGRDLDYESLYEEKLKEFLKVRERMIKSNKIKDNGLDIEDILKSTLMESKRTNTTVEPHNLMSMQKYTYTNSPATARSFGKPEPPKLSSRDLMLSPPVQALEYQKHPFQTMKYAQELPEYRVPTFESEPKKQEYHFMNQTKQVRSPLGKNKMEQIEELGQLADDFYDDGLFDLVDDIEKKGSSSAAQSNSSVLPESKASSSRNKNSIANVDDEFKTLFTTVKTMFSPNDDTTTDRIREQLFGRSPKFEKSGFEKSGLTGFNTSKLSYDEDDVENESILNLPAQVLNMNEKGISRKTSGQRSTGSATQVRASKTDVSAVESDASMLMINRKINEMKKKKKPMKF